MIGCRSRPTAGDRGFWARRWARCLWLLASLTLAGCKANDGPQTGSESHF